MTAVREQLLQELTVTEERQRELLECVSILDQRLRHLRESVRQLEQAEYVVAGLRIPPPPALPPAPVKAIEVEIPSEARARAAHPAGTATAEHVCSDCGRSFDSAQGVSLHRRRAHGPLDVAPTRGTTSIGRLGPVNHDQARAAAAGAAYDDGHLS